MKFVSHLDMNRYVTRLIKMSKIPARYTEGFHQHLYITFALPLSLGTTADYDVFDIKLTDDLFSLQEVKRSLANNAADGIEILSVEEPWMNVSELKYAEFSLTYKDNDSLLLTRLSEMFKSKVILVNKKGKKGKTTEINLADKIFSIKQELTGCELKVTVMLPAGNDENINPSLFLQAFCDIGNRKPEICEINRNMIYNASKEIFK